MTGVDQSFRTARRVALAGIGVSDLHIEVDPTLTVAASRAIAGRVHGDRETRAAVGGGRPDSR